jgi:CheY-like chemotaxis protein
MRRMQGSVSSALVLDGTLAGRALIADVLRSEGIEVLEATRGDEALDLARERRPDLIVADLGTPGMDGDEFTLALRTDPATREMPVVLCGESRDERELWRLASACGAARVLIKPCAREELINAVDELLSRPI